ncbi:MAG TPA: ABC transporter permease [Anaerolineaceae bacterium]
MKAIDIALKDMLRSFRSLFAIGMMVAAPLMISGLIYFAFGGMGSGSADLPALTVAIVNQDQPYLNSQALGDTLVEMFNDQSVASWLKSYDVKSEDEARAAVNRQEAGMAVIIPANLSRVTFGGEGKTSILLVQDPTLTISPVVVRNMIGSLLDGVSGAGVAVKVIQERSGERIEAGRLQVLLGQFQTWFANFQRTLYHSPQSALVFQTPAALNDSQSGGGMQQILAMVVAGQLIFFAFYTGAYSMMSILRETEEGTLARLFTTPTNRSTILAGKFLSVVLMVLVQTWVMMLAGVLLFGVRWGQPLAVALADLGLVISATGLGVLLISLIKTSRQAGPILGGALSGLGMLGGLFTVAMPMPEGFLLLNKFTPHGWVLEAWKLAINGSPAIDLLPAFAILIALGAGMFFVGAQIFRRRFA